MATFDALIPERKGGMEFLSILKFDGEPAYCIEPEVTVQIQGGKGPRYQSGVWDLLPEEKKTLCKRIAYFGYGNPMTGSDGETYAATQMLIWKVLGSQSYDAINRSLSFRKSYDLGTSEGTEGRKNLDSIMNRILDLAESYDTVPSFAESSHGIRTYGMIYGVPLNLKDDHGMLEHFSDESEESHPGLSVLSEADQLRLTFQRKPEEWKAMQNGILLYTRPDHSQRLFAAGSENPVPRFQLAVTAETADLEIRKTDEYGRSGSWTAGTEFCFGMMNEDGTEGEAWKNPDGTVKICRADPDGIVRIRDLPAEHSFWIGERSASDRFKVTRKHGIVKTGKSGTTASYVFVNQLREVTLELIKQDEEDPDRKLNDAEISVYEIGDLDLSGKEVPEGIAEHLPASAPSLTARQLLQHSNNGSQKSFRFNGWQYEIEQETPSEWIAEAAPQKRDEHQELIISRYQLPEKIEAGETFEVKRIVNMHGTFDPADDETAVLHLRIERVSGNLVTVSDLDPSEDLIAAEATEPSYAQVAESADAYGIPMEEGKQVIVDGISYVLKNPSGHRVTLHREKIFRIALDDPAPCISDLPDLRQLHAGDQFSKKIPGSEVLQTFTVVSIGTHEISVQTDGKEYVLAKPRWISQDDLPAETEDQNTFEVVSVHPAEYDLSDSRGNLYHVTAEGTKLLKTAEGNQAGQETDLTYAEISCMQGDELSRTVTRTESIPYSGPQWEELNENDWEYLHAGTEPEKEKGLPAGESPESSEQPVSSEEPVPSEISEPISSSSPMTSEPSEPHPSAEPEQTQVPMHWNENLKPVAMHGDDDLEVCVISDGASYIAHLHPSVPADHAFRKIEETVVFRRISIQKPEYEISWKEDPYGTPLWIAPEESCSLIWTALPLNAAKGTVFEDKNGNTWTILSIDEKKREAVIQGKAGRWRIARSGQESILPLHYADLTADHCAEGNSFAIPYQRILKSGDVIQKDGIPYLVEETDPFRVSYFWEKDAPFGPSDLIGKTSILKDGNTWTISSAENGKNLEHVISDESGHMYHCFSEVISDPRRTEKIHGEDPIRIRVKKPDAFAWQDLEHALHQPKQKGGHIRLDDQVFEIEEVSGEKIVLKNGGEIKKITAGKEAGQEAYLEEVMELPLELAAGDVYELNGRKMKLVSLSNQHGTGRTARLTDLQNRRSYTIEEKPEGQPLETEYLHIRMTGKDYLLKDFGDAESWKLEQADQNVYLNPEHQTIRSEGTGSAILVQMKNDGTVLGRTRILFCGNQEEQDLDALPVFSGKTGHQYVRVLDPLRHNAPIPGVKLEFFSDENLKNKAGERTTDIYGAADLSEFAPGTYWYVSPQNEKKSASVLPAEQMTGRLRIEGLKWGRNYLAAEIRCPKGYEYGSMDPVQFLTMEVSSEKEELHSLWTNRLRRLSIRVYKEDQDNQRTLLDNAWFHASDITYAEGIEEKSDALIALADLPPETEAGDLIPVWPAKPDGALHAYRIREVKDTEVIVEEQKGDTWCGTIAIPRKGAGASAPFLYSDLTRQAEELKTGEVFRIAEKQPRSILRFYRILSAETEASEDLFGNASEKRRIVHATAVDPRDSASVPISIGRSSDQVAKGEIDLGEAVSGGIVIRKTMMRKTVPLTFEELQNLPLFSSLKEGSTLSAPIRHTAPLPPYETLAKADKGKTFRYGSESWLAEDPQNGICSLHGQRFRIGMDTSGAMEWNAEETLTVKEVIRKNGTITGVTLSDHSGNSWFLSSEDQRADAEVGRAGIEVTVHPQNDPDQIAARAYTDADGRSVYVYSDPITVSYNSLQ
ncbi:MAG: thioester domain-containing protein [Bulleidia sp.]